MELNFNNITKIDNCEMEYKRYSGNNNFSNFKTALWNSHKAFIEDNIGNEDNYLISPMTHIGFYMSPLSYYIFDKTTEKMHEIRIFKSDDDFYLENYVLDSEFTDGIVYKHFSHTVLLMASYLTNPKKWDSEDSKTLLNNFIFGLVEKYPTIVDSYVNKLSKDVIDGKKYIKDIVKK